MIEPMLKVAKNNTKSTISIITIGTVLGGFFGVEQYFDTRYLFASDGEHIQQSINLHQIYELEDKIFIINLKQQGLDEAAIEQALKARYEEQLKALRKEGNGE